MYHMKGRGEISTAKSLNIWGLNEVHLTGVIIGSRLGDLLGHEGRGLRAKEALTLIRVLPQQTQMSFSFKASRVAKNITDIFV